MIKGFHIPLYLDEKKIIKLADICLNNHDYNWIEIKWAKNYIGNDSRSYERGIRYIVDHYNVGVSCHIPTNIDLGQTNTGMRDEAIHQIKLCIDYASKFNAKILPIHPGTILTMDIPITDETKVKKNLILEGKRKEEDARDLSVSIIQEIADYAKKYEMIIAIENLLLPQEIVHTALELKEIVKLCNRENVKALYDCGHAYRVNQNVSDFIRILDKDLCHVHLNDNDGTCDLHLQLKEGKIPFDEIFKALAEINYKGALVVETDYKGDDEELAKAADIIDAYLGRK